MICPSVCLFLPHTNKTQHTLRPVTRKEVKGSKLYILPTHSRFCNAIIIQSLNNNLKKRVSSPFTQQQSDLNYS